MKIMKRVLSAFLAVVLVFSMLPVPAFAAEDPVSGDEIYLDPTLPTEETKPETTEPESSEPEGSEPDGTEPEGTEPEGTEPEGTEPEGTEPEGTEPEGTEPEGTEPEGTEPEGTEPEGTEPEETEPEETEPEETEPEETEPEETEPEEELERVPMEPKFFDWYLKESVYTDSETITMVEQLEEGVFRTSEFTEEKSGTVLGLEQVFDYPMAAMALRGTEIPSTFKNFDELTQILNAGYPGDLVLTYKGNSVLVIQDDLTIPENVTLLTDNSAKPWGSPWYDRERTAHLSVYVPAGVELTVNGSLQVAGLKLEGDLTVNGFVMVNRGIHIPQFCGAVVRLNSRNLYLDPDCHYDVDLSNVVDVNDDGSYVYYWHDIIRTKDEFVAEMEAINNNTGAFAHRVLVEQEEHFLLDTDVTIARRVLLPISGENGIDGGFGITVAEGCTLTNNSEWVVILGVPMQVNGTLVNNSDFLYVQEKLEFGESGSYAGRGKLKINRSNATVWTDKVSGLNSSSDMYKVSESVQEYCWILENAANTTRLPAPKNLAWHKRVLDGSVVNQKGHIYWELDGLDTQNYLVRIYNAKTDEVIQTINYCYGMDLSTNQRSLPHMLFDAIPSGSYYFTVTMLPEPDGREGAKYTKDYYFASETVKSPVWNYTKPGRTLGIPSNLTVSWPLVAWDTPANATANTMYYVEYYFTPSLDQTPVPVGYNNQFTGNYNQIWSGLTDTNKDGYYSFRVKALSEDMTQKCTGTWSDLSDPYYFNSKTTAADESFLQANVDLNTGSIRLDQKLILKNDFTIPESTFLNITDGGSITVPAGVTLTVSGGAYLSQGSLIVMPGGTLNLKSTVMMDEDSLLNVVDVEGEIGGSVNFGEGGCVELVFCNGEFLHERPHENPIGIPQDKISLQIIVDRSTDSDQLEKALTLFEQHADLGYGSAVLNVHTSMELPRNLKIPETGLFHVDNGCSLTIPSDVTVTIDGELYIWQNCTLNNWGIIHVNRALQIFGSLNNNGAIILRTPVGADIEAILGVYENAIVNNMGTVLQHYGAAVYRHARGKWTGNAVENAFAAFKKKVAAAALEYDTVELNDTVVVAENYTIPDKVTLNLYGGTIIVPSGKTLTLNSWTNMENGTIIVEEGGKLQVNADVDIMGGDTIRVDGTVSFAGDGFFNVRYDQENDKIVDHNITGVSDCVGLRIWNFDPSSKALEAFQNAVPGKFERAVLICERNMTISRDFTVPAGGIFHVYNGATLTLDSDVVVQNYGNIIVWEGSTLDNNGHINNYSAIDVHGTIENDGEISVAPSEESQFYPYVHVYDTGTVHNYNLVAVEPDAEVWCNGTWYGSYVHNHGGYIGGSGIFYRWNEWGEQVPSNISMSQQALLAAMKQTPSGWAYNLENVVRLTGNVTLNKYLNIFNGAAIYVPKGVTLTVNGGMTVCEGGSIIVEAGGKLVNGGENNITVNSDVQFGGIFYVAEGGTYTQKDYAGIMVCQNGYSGSANIHGVDISLQTAYAENPNISEFKDVMDKAMDGYARAFVITDNLVIPKQYVDENSDVETYLTIPWNAEVIVNPSDYGVVVKNEAKLKLYGHIWVNSQWDDRYGYSVPADFVNTGTIEVSEGGWMTFSGNVQNDGTIWAGISGWLQTWPDFGRTWVGNAPVFAGGASNYTYATAGDRAWAMSQEEFLAMLNNKDIPEIYLDTQVLLDKSAVLNKPVTIGPNGGLVVDYGATLTVNSELTVEAGGDLVVYSSCKLVNNGEIFVNSQADKNGIFCVYGAYTGQNIFAVMNEGEPNIEYLDKSCQTAYFWDSRTEKSFEEVLKDESLKNYGNIHYHVTGDETNTLVLEGDNTLVIPNNVILSMGPKANITLNRDVDLYGVLYVNSYYGPSGKASKLTICEGRTLTIKNGGLLDSYGDVYNEGTVLCHHTGKVVNEGDWYGAPVTEAGTMPFTTLQTELASCGDSDYYLNQNVVLGGNITAEESPVIHIQEDGHIIVPSGRTLTVQELFVEGGRITVQSGGTLKVVGDLTVVDSQNGLHGIVTVERGGILMNSGNIIIGKDGDDSLTGGTLACWGTYRPSGKHSITRFDAIYNEYCEPTFTGYVAGIANNYQDLEDLIIDGEYPGENGWKLYCAVENIKYYGYRGAHVYLHGKAYLYDDLTIPEYWSVDYGKIVNYATLTVAANMTGVEIKNYGQLNLNKPARVENINVSGNMPVCKDAAVFPMTSGITLEAKNPDMVTVKNNNTITVDANDALGVGADGMSAVTLDILVNPLAVGPLPNQNIGFTSSNKKVLDPANIVKNADGTYSFLNMSAGTTRLTITTMASKQTGETGGKMWGKTLSHTVTVTVTPTKAASVVLKDSPEMNSTEPKIFDKSADVRTFTLCTDILDAKGRIVPGKQITWSSSDSRIASVKDTGNGTVLVTVQKNVDGVAMITAQVRDQRDITATLDVTVRDLSPRLGSTTISLNPYLVAGTSVDLIESYGNTIRSVAVDNPNLSVSYSDGYLTLKAKEYTLKQQTLRNVMLHVFTDEGEYNYKLTVNVAPAYPKITVKQSANLDLFYTDNQQILNVTAQNAVVTAVRMDGTADFLLRHEDGSEILSFSEYLKKAYPDDTRYRPDNTADISVMLEGYYGETVVKNFRIGTTTSRKTFQILSEANGKLVNPVKLQRFLEQELELGIYEKVGKDQFLTVMDDIGTTDKDATIQQTENGHILVDCGANRMSRRVTLVIKQDGWMRAQQVAFQLTVDNAKPTVKLKAGTVTLNSLLMRNVWTGITTTMGDAEDLQISFSDFVATRPNAETEKLNVGYWNDEIKASIPSIEIPKNGTYAFKATPYAVNVDGETVALTPVTLNVRVVSDKPSVKLKKGTLTLNSIFMSESDMTDITSTLVEPGEVHIDEFVATRPNAETDKISVQYENGQITAWIQPGETPKNGTYAFKATPYIRSVSGDRIDLTPVTVNVKIISNKPVVKLNKSTLTLNSLFKSENDFTDVTVTMVEPEEVFFDTFVATRPNVETEKIGVQYKDGQITAWIQPGETPKNGTYAFKATPYVLSDGGDRVDLTSVTVNVRVVNNKPKVKLKSSTLTLSRLFPQTTSADWSLDREGLTLTSDVTFFPVTVNNASQMEQAQKISVAMYNGSVEAFLDINDLPKAGRYSYYAYPSVTNGNDVADLDKVTVTVVVEDKKVPTVKLQTSSVRLNTNLSGSEFTEIPVTFTDKTGYSGLEFNGFEIVNNYEDKVTVKNIRDNEGNVDFVKVQLKAGAPKGTYKIDLYPLINAENVTNVKLAKLTMTVNAYTSAVKVTTKTTGKLDALDMNSFLRYSITRIDNALGVNNNNLVQVSKAVLVDGAFDNGLFQTEGLKLDSAGKPYFDVMLRDNVTYDLKKTYEIQVAYTIWDQIIPVNYKFKVTQTTLKAAAVPVMTFYQSAGKPLNVQLALTSPAYARIDRIEFNKARSSRELASAMNVSGNIEVYRSKDNVWKTDAAFALEFAKLGSMKNGATYNLVLDVYPKHHALNANPLQVTVKVKIIK